MPERQLHLFAPPSALLLKLGAQFFQAAPRVPGVYIMTGRNHRVLYIGQSANLRARLASYKNARPDRVSRKTIRLVRSVESIVWEKCESPEAARLRENALLRLHRPQFNRLNTYPRAHSFISLKADAAGLELGRTHRPEPGVELFGAFKTRAVAGFGALLRLTWGALHQPASPHEFPAPLVKPVPPRHYRLNWAPLPARLELEDFLTSLRAFLEGTSERLLELLAAAQPNSEALCSFQRSLQSHDLEVLSEFYHFGARRNYELRKRHHLPGALISQEELDDLLALEPTGPKRTAPESLKSR